MNTRLKTSLVLTLILAGSLFLMLKNKEVLSPDNQQRNKVQEPILIGLKNLDATCHMNATIQCFSNTKELTDYFFESYEKNPQKTLSNEYYKLLQKLWDKKNKNVPFSPDSFKEVLNKENILFATNVNKDPKNIFVFLLEKLHEELNNVKERDRDINNNDINTGQTNEKAALSSFLQTFKERYNSPISNLFYIVKKETLQCNGCKIPKYKFQTEPYMDFPLKEVNKYICKKKGRILNNAEHNTNINLYECFDYYIKAKMLTEEDKQPFCGICKKKEEALCVSSIYSVPNNLIINLNRGNGDIYKGNVDFPGLLNLSNYITVKEENSKFELYAVICNINPNNGNGHFVAYCKNRIDNKWYQYNDEKVEQCTDLNEYKNGMACVLFYRAVRV